MSVPVAVGGTAPDFRLPTTDGSVVDSADLRGAPAVVVALWCNHCPYVQAWEERFNAVAGDYAGRGVRVVAVNANDAVSYPADDLPSMVARARDRGYLFPYAQDTEQTVARAFGATRTPEVFLMDADWQVRYHGAIDDSMDSEGVTVMYLRDALEAVLAGAPAPIPETGAVGCTIKWRP